MIDIFNISLFCEDIQTLNSGFSLYLEEQTKQLVVFFEVYGEREE